MKNRKEDEDWGEDIEIITAEKSWKNDTVELPEEEMENEEAINNDSETETIEELEEFVDNDEWRENLNEDIEIVITDEEYFDDNNDENEDYEIEVDDEYFENDKNENEEYEIVSDDEWKEECVEYFSDDEEWEEFSEEENAEGEHKIVSLCKTAFIPLGIGQKSKTYSFYYIPSYENGMMQKPKISLSSVKGANGLSLSASSNPIFDSNYIKIKASREKSTIRGKATGYIYVATNDRKYTIEVTISCK